ncbi:MAG: hypothetical protein Q8Q73_19140 [Stagnimonas sp.]|nr:hypothetical protein [Stagnimonas sp.]
MSAEQKHTPEPWSLETVPTSIGTCHMIGPFPSRGAKSETHACIYADSVRMGDYGHSAIGDELRANAERIVACVNAMAGVTDPASYIATLQERIDTFSESAAAYMAERDELLAALQAAYLLALSMPDCMARVRGQPTYCLMRDTIAKLTGRESEKVQNEYEERAVFAKHGAAK